MTSRFCRLVAVSRRMIFSVVLLGAWGAPLSLAAVNDWYVDKNAPDCGVGSGGASDPFCSISLALAFASDGDTIHVAPGTYQESLLLNKDITLIGTGGEQVTILDGTGSVRLIEVLASSIVQLRGWTIQGGYVASDGGAGIRVRPGSSLDLSDCTVRDNVAHHGNGAGILVDGGAALMLTNATVRDNTAVQEVTYVSRYSWDCLAGYGGGILNYGSTVIHGSQITANQGAIGGGIFQAAGDMTLSNSTVSANQANPCNKLYVYHDGNGGGVHRAGGTLDLDSSTLAGNSARSGGGLHCGGGVVTASHTLLAGNEAASTGPDCLGILHSTEGHLLLGDTSACALTGPQPGTLPDVDPLFVDAAGGDFSLNATSPAVDAGDPLRVSLDRDVAGFPRLLDGDLNRSMVVDIGAHEFSHVRFSVTGNATPGGSLTLDTTGTPGLPVALFAGLAGPGALLASYGPLFVDLGLPFVFLPFGTIPRSVVATIPLNAPAPITFALQELALAGGGAGNFSNPIQLTVE